MRWLPKLRKWGWAIRIAGYTVILDACVLYPAPLRDFLLELAGSGMFRTRRLMNDSVLGSLVEGFEDLIPALELPDPDDRHVLAAAIHSGSDAIVTINLKDFPADVARRYDLEILHPDDFLYQQFGLDPATVVLAARNCRARLKSPPRSGGEYLATLEAQGLPLLASELRKFEDLI